MEIKKGRDRCVFVFPSAGIVIKCARIFPLETLYYFLYDVTHGGWRRVSAHWKMPMDGSLFRSYKFLLFSGIATNFRERRFYRETRNPLLQPTYFSLFGLVNIQRYGKPLNMDKALFWKRMYCIVPEVDLIKDVHHFHNPENFCWNGERLYILDYGRTQTQQVIERYGKEIQEFFLP